MINPQDRIQNWIDRIKFVAPDALHWGVMYNRRNAAIAQVTSVFPIWAAYEYQIKQVLDGLGVSMALYAMYLSFGRKIGALVQRDISGTSLDMACDDLVTLWTAYGLNAGTMGAIRLQVFNC